MKRADFAQLGFNQYQSANLEVVFSLNHPEEIQAWMQAVEPEDVLLGISLLELAALAMLDREVETMTDLSLAQSVIRQVQ